MKTINKAIVLAAITAIAGFSAPVLAADPPAAAPAAGTISMQSFGVLDMNKVMQTTDAAKDILGQLEKKRKEYQAQIAKEEDSLRAAEADLAKQKDTLSKEEFEKKRAAFEEKVLAGQKFVQDRKRILDQAFTSSIEALRKEAVKIVAQAAEERKYAAVFTQEAVMIASPQLDITDIVIERMNKTVKKIPVEWSAPAEAKKK